MAKKSPKIVNVVKNGLNNVVVAGNVLLESSRFNKLFDLDNSVIPILYLLNTIKGIKSNLTITHQGQDKKEIKHTQLMFYQLISFYNYRQSS